MSEKKRRVGGDNWSDDRKRLESALSLLLRRGTESDALVQAIDKQTELFRMLLEFLSHSDVTPLIATNRWYREFWEHDARAVRAPFDMKIMLDGSFALRDVDTDEPQDRLARFLHSVRRQWPRARSMQLTVDTGSQTRDVEIESILERLPASLRSLDITIEEATDDAVQAVRDAMPVLLDRCRGLERLNLSATVHDWGTRFWTAETLAMIPKMTSLTRLAVDEPMTFRTLDAIVKWSGVAKLVEWHLQLNTSPPAVSQIAAALKAMPSLTTCEITADAELENFDFKTLLEALPVKLQHLVMWTEVQTMEDCVASMQHLKRLVKFRGYFLSTEVKSLATLLRGNSELEDVDIHCPSRENEYGGQQPGVDFFEATMHSCPKLRRFELHFETKGGSKLPDASVLGRWLTTHPLVILNDRQQYQQTSQLDRWRIHSITGNEVRDARFVKFLNASHVRVDQFVTTGKTWEQDQWDLVRSRVRLFHDDTGLHHKGASIHTFVTADATERVFMDAKSPLFSAVCSVDNPVVRFAPSIRCDLDSATFNHVASCFTGAGDVTLQFPGSKVDWDTVAKYIWQHSPGPRCLFFDWGFPASVVAALLGGLGRKSWDDMAEESRTLCLLSLEDAEAIAAVRAMASHRVGKFYLTATVPITSRCVISLVPA